MLGSHSPEDQQNTLAMDLAAVDAMLAGPIEVDTSVFMPNHNFIQRS